MFGEGEKKQEEDKRGKARNEGEGYSDWTGRMMMREELNSHLVQRLDKTSVRMVTKIQKKTWYVWHEQKVRNALGFKVRLNKLNGSGYGQYFS